MSTWLTRSLVLAALALAGVAAYLGYRDHARRPDPEFVVDQPERDLGVIRAGAHTVELGITNPARRPRQIIGLREG